MYIDGDTHYWPVRFLERVKHSGRGHIEFQKGAGEMIRYGEKFPGDEQPIIAMARRSIRSARRAGILTCTGTSWRVRDSTIKS